MPLTGLAALAQVVGVTVVTVGAILIHGVYNDKKEKNTTNTNKKEEK
jgi:uncharacterized membrane protein HdeD (DUF308 family)